jgi:hypothetical protein
MKYAAGMGSVAVHTYIPKFIQIGSDIQNLLGGGYIDTQTVWRSHKPIVGK